MKESTLLSIALKTLSRNRVREKEREEREKERERGREGGRRESVCVCERKGERQ